MKLAIDGGMKPIAVFQHTEVGAPGTLLPALKAMGCPVRLVRILDGEPVPVDASAFGGLVFLGGGMSVHDDLPWISQELTLIRDAAELGLPVAGHCLGSQLVAVALGGHVHRHAIPEIGWHSIKTGGDDVARNWWGPHAGREVTTFQWHGDTFVPPSGAVPIARGDHCENQAFVLDDRHLMLQSHLEMTPALVELSLQRNGGQLMREQAAGNPAVTSIEETRRRTAQHTAEMAGVLRQLYERWVEGCR